MSDNLRQQLEILPELFSAHLQLTLSALAMGILISLPLAILTLRIRRLQGPLLGAASVVQTVPSLALLALMVPLLGKIGFTPALIALVLYSMLPILRNTVTGIEGVDAAMVEAGRGLGMTENQVLFKVQAPLAAPVIIAGVRTATVWVVGIATLATPVGAASLGNFIFSGLQTQNMAAVLVGCVTTAVLAIVLDGIVRLMQVASERRSPRLAVGSSAAMCALIAVAVAPLITTRGATGATRPTVVIGAKTFTEQYILSEVLADALERGGMAAQRKPGMGSTILFDSLRNGSVDCYADYSGTIWTNIMKRQDWGSRQDVLKEMTRWLREQYGITCLGSLGFENAYALAMSRRKARELGIRSIADLAAHAPDLSMGGDYEFFARPEWRKLRDAYGLNFGRTINMDSTLMYSAIRQGQVDVICAFSSDGRVAAQDLLVLKDPKQALPPYDAVILLSPKAAENAKITAALRPLLGTIDDDKMRQANRMVDLEGRSVKAAAELLIGGQ